MMFVAAHLEPVVRWGTHVRYTGADWRQDVIATGLCLCCGKPPTFLAPDAAECRRCERWFLGYLVGAGPQEHLKMKRVKGYHPRER